MALVYWFIPTNLAIHLHRTVTVFRDSAYVVYVETGLTGVNVCEMSSVSWQTRKYFLSPFVVVDHRAGRRCVRVR